MAVPRGNGHIQSHTTRSIRKVITFEMKRHAAGPIHCGPPAPVKCIENRVPINGCEGGNPIFSIVRRVGASATVAVGVIDRAIDRNSPDTRDGKAGKEKHLEQKEHRRRSAT
jgi:hypothetical protein